jgi:hypothetical protein
MHHTRGRSAVDPAVRGGSPQQGRRLLAISAIACALVALPLAGAAPAQSQPVNAFGGLPPSTAGIHLWAPLHMAGGKITSQSEAVAAAKLFDLITIHANRSLVQYEPAMRTANPAMRLFVYINGAYIYKSQLGQLPSSALSHTAGGALIRSRMFGNILGNPSSAAFILFKQHECAAAMKTSGADGCYLDMLGTGPLVSGYDTGLPVNPATGTLWNVKTWLTTESALAGAVGTFSGSQVLSNGFFSGKRYFSAAGPTRLLLGGTGGSTAEGFVKDPTSSSATHESESLWYQDVQMLQDANAAGGAVLTMTKTWGSTTSAQRTAWQRFSLATYLLGNSGHSYFFFTGSRDQSALMDSPLYHLNVGSAQGATTESTAGYCSRTFSNGRVVVNPTGHVVTVPLSRRYRTSGGQLVSSSISLGAYGAEILTNA